MKKLTAAAAAFAVLGITATAQAETLGYDFTMVITEMSDPEGAFDAGGLKLGEALEGTVELNSGGDGDGVANFSIQGLDTEVTNPWGTSNATTWTWAGADSVYWNAGAGTPVDTVNSIDLHGWAQENLFLKLSKDDNLEMGAGSYYELRLSNGFNSFLRAEFSETAGGGGGGGGVPELSPIGGMGAGAFLFGLGLVLAGRRRRSA